MKLVKLSLVAALAVGSFSALDAKPLEDAIRGVDISGWARYRYDSMSWSNGSDTKLTAGSNAVNDKQTHRFRTYLNTKIHIGDGFSVFGQLMYNNDKNGGYGNTKLNSSGKTVDNTSPSGAATKNSIVLKQAYLQYDAKDLGLSVIAGRQALGTIWTEDLTGMAAKVLFTPAPGLTFAVFAVDSIEGGFTDGNYDVGDTDATRFNPYLDPNALPVALTYPTQLFTPTVTATTISNLNKRLYSENIYGAAYLGDFGPAKTQIWAAHWDKTATLYALKADVFVPFGQKGGLNIHFNYLGNVLDGVLKHDIDAVSGQLAGKDVSSYFAGGNLFQLGASMKIVGFDAQLGGLLFGKKDSFTINTLEGFGGTGFDKIGREIFYQKGSWLPLAFGQSNYYYVGAGYTFPESVRIGVQGVIGATYNDDLDGLMHEWGAGTKMEFVAELGYKPTKALDLLLWYSNLNTKEDYPTTGHDQSIKNTVRFQAIYKF